MNPIPTTKAMNPAPAKGIQSFPTPVIQDIVISEIVNAWKGDYQKLEYGTKWDDVPHASQQGSFPDHKLIFQQPASEDGQWVKRIWANDRIDQDSYNYAIKYSGGSDQHPIYIRTYIEPRATYAPVPDLTPDLQHPKALLVEEEVQRTEGELDSEYVKVVRVFETLPGPSVTSQRYNERGDLETINVQTVSPSTAPDPDGLLVTQTQVLKEDVSKGTKTTATVPSHSTLLIKEKKEGLLGETVTTDDIVDPATNPDALSQSVVTSVVQQTSATKAVKRTTTATGPTSLTQQSKDGKLLGDVTSTESVVAPNETPDSPSEIILSSEVKQVDSGKAIKRNVVLNSTPTLEGGQSGEGLLGTRETVEEVVSAGTQPDAVSLTIISSQVEPIDSIRSRKVTVSSVGPTSLSGGQKKEGLLGETDVIESIVEAGSPPDALSQTVVSSTIEPIDSAKSKKTTITATGPTSLSQKSKDGKLLGDITITESIVAPNAIPDSPSGTTSGILSSEIKQVDSGKAVKRNAVLNSSPVLAGSQKQGGLLGEVTTTEKIVAAGTAADDPTLTIVSSSVEPIDTQRSRKVTQTSSGPTVLTGSAKKDGLLGETTITESIVAAGTSPDNLSDSVISSEVTPIDAAKSKKTTATSAGPLLLSGNRINERGEIETIRESIVSSNSSPDADSVNTISSEVEPIDSAKSKKTTVTVKSRATLTGGKSDSGLLGRTSITDTIVPHPASPDELTWSDTMGGIIQSSVEPISSTKARKVTIQSSRPKKLTAETLIDSQLGLVKATVEKSIVSQSTEPIKDPGKGLKTVKDSINSLDSVKSERELVEVDEWPENVGVDYDEQLGIGIYYTETIVSPNEYTNPPYWEDLSNTDYKAIDQWKSLKKQIDIERVSEALLSQYYKISIAVPIKLPDKLLGVTAYFANSYGAGADFDITQGANTGSYNLSNSGSSKSSWSIGGDIYFNIEDGFDGIVDGFKHIFFMKINNGSVSSESILEVLNNFAQFGQQTIPKTTLGNQLTEGDRLIERNATYKKWPYIKTKTENIVVITGGRSKSKSLSRSESAGINGSASSEGTGESFDVNVNANSINVPKTLHPAITIQQTEVNSVTDTKGIQKPYISIQPPVLRATSPSIFPVGNYLISADVELYKWGFVKVTAITANITEEYI